MKDTKERTALGEAILRHWREHCPQMVQDMEKQNCLDRAVFETQERTGDLLYELMAVRKMDYLAAWELAREEWALSRSQSGDLPPMASPSSAKSGSATSSRKRPRRRRRGTSG